MATSRAIQIRSNKTVQRPDEFVRLVNKIADNQTSVIAALAEKQQKGSEDEVVTLLGDLEMSGVQVSTLAKFAKLALGQVFQYFIENWDVLPEKFRQRYNGCYGYIQQRYSCGDQMADMYAFVWEAWFSGKYTNKVPEFVKVADLPVVKMRVVAPYIMRGEMNPKMWKSLSDDTMTRSQLSKSLRKITKTVIVSRKNKGPGSRGPEPKPHDSTVILLETGDVRRYVRGDIKTIGQLRITDPDQEVRSEVRRICKMRGIRIIR